MSEGVDLIFASNPFNFTQETKEPMALEAGEDDLNARNSAPRPAHCIHWGEATEDWIPAF